MKKNIVVKSPNTPRPWAIRACGEQALEWAYREGTIDRRVDAVMVAGKYLEENAELVATASVLIAAVRDYLDHECDGTGECSTQNALDHKHRYGCEKRRKLEAILATPK
jgi:hypothetical protein